MGTLTNLKPYALGIAIALGAMVVRAVLSPWLGDSAPFLLAVPAVPLIAWVAGFGPAIVGVLLCAAWAITPQLPPTVPLPHSWQTLGLFVVSSGVLAWIGSRLAALARRTPIRVPETGSALRWLQAAAWLAAVVPAIAFVVVALYLYQDTITQANSDVERAAVVAQEHAQKILETNIALIDRVRDLLGDDPDSLLLNREALIHQKLVVMTADLPQLQGLFVLSGQARMLATNRVYPAPHEIDYSDRELFRHHRDGGAQPLVTEVLTSRATGELFFDVSLRRSRADGTFNGAVSTSLRPEYFYRFYEELLKGRRTIGLALVRADGAVLASWPNPPKPSDRPGGSTPWAIDAPSGVSRGRIPGDADGIRALQSVGRYPMKVMAWESLSAALAPWYEQLYARAALLLPVVVALVAVTQIARQKAARSLAAFDELRDEVARRQQVEDILRQAQKLEAMGRVTGGVAHDFNNLLMVVQNNLHLLRLRNRVPDDNAEVKAIERAINGGTKLTRQLLSFSRAQPLNSEMIDLSSGLPDMLDMIRPAIGGTIEAQLEVQAGTRKIQVDKAELELALLNLSLNARDAMPNGGRLRVIARNAQPQELVGIAGDFVLIEVADSGSGIDPAVIDRVFEPFFTTKPPSQGTGLGLSQVYAFCTRSGGTARVASQPGQGTTICMVLPAADAIAAAKSAAEFPVAPPVQSARILLVEDNLEVASATAEVLESYGCHVTRAESADAAWKLLETRFDDFDVVLSDVLMPGELSGVDLALRIRRSTLHLPVVLITGYTKLLSEAEELGLDILMKPLSPAVLLDTITKAVERSRPHEAPDLPQPAPQRAG